MALTINTNIKNDADGYSLDASQVKGTYVAVATIAERDALPKATIIDGSVCYVKADSTEYIASVSNGTITWTAKTSGAAKNSIIDRVSALPTTVDENSADFILVE